jgi:hypothetical protein
MMKVPRCGGIAALHESTVGVIVRDARTGLFRLG